MKHENVVLSKLLKVKLPHKNIEKRNLRLIKLLNAIFSYYFCVAIVILPLTGSVTRPHRRTTVVNLSGRIIPLLNSLNSNHLLPTLTCLVPKPCGRTFWKFRLCI